MNEELEEAVVASIEKWQARANKYEQALREIDKEASQNIDSLSDAVLALQEIRSIVHYTALDKSMEGTL